MAERSARRVRLVRATVAVALALAVGTWGYSYLSEGNHTFVEALYMTVISISTVGFNEVIPIQDDAMRVFTMGLILFGGASVVYFLTAVAAFVVEGDFLYGFWRRRLRAQLRRVHDHVIVCGLGRVGSHAFAELHRARHPVVGIDRETTRVDALMHVRGPGILFMVGDAADEEILRELGVTRARTLIAALADDRDNFLLCVTARQLNPEIGLMVRLVEPTNADMFTDLAADAVVHPPALSGVRLANELLLPDLTAFTDQMLEGEAQLRKLAEVVIPARSPLIGEPIAALDPQTDPFVKAAPRLPWHASAKAAPRPPWRMFAKAAQRWSTDPGLLVLGVRRAGAAAEAAFAFGPSWQHRVQAGDTVFVLTGRAALKGLMARVEGRAAPRAQPVVSDLGGSSASSPNTEVAGRHGHVVVVGAGAVGRSAVREILRQGVDVTVIDRSEQHLALLAPDPRLVKLVADVGQRETLVAADIAGARGFITALQPLRDNLFLASSVHRGNPGVRVVARVGNQAEARRLRAVGASIVNPGQIGGVDLAHRTMRPELVAFARGLEASWSHPEQLAVVAIESLPDGVRDLVTLDIPARTSCVILGYRARANELFTYHPTPATRLRIGGSFVALGEPNNIEALRALLGPPGAPRSEPPAGAR